MGEYSVATILVASEELIGARIEDAIKADAKATRNTGAAPKTIFLRKVILLKPEVDFRLHPPRVNPTLICPLVFILLLTDTSVKIFASVFLTNLHYT